MNKRFNITETKKKENIFCPHYNKYTYLVSKCCNKIYPCRNCHDANENHKLNRHDIDFMKCDFCKCLQKVSDKCINPDCNYNKKHAYFCKICNLWFNIKDEYKVFINSLLIQDINIYRENYHCLKCGICRIGSSEDFIHCDNCNLCVNKKIYETHPCKINAKEHNCPICLKENWGVFNESIHILNCGHIVHSKCYIDSLTAGNYQCPLCKKSTVDMTNQWNQLDIMLENQEMPDEYVNWKSNIHCNDCENKSNTKYHFFYHKCKECNSYNTVVENIIKN